MKGYLIWWGIIFGLYFAIKLYDYQFIIITKGIVVGHGAFSYSPVRNAFSAHAAIPYPIAEYRDTKNDRPTSKVTLAMVIDSVEWDSVNKYNMKYLLLDKQRELLKQHDSFYGIYTTIYPEGGFFFSEYPLGDSIKVFYSDGKASQGKVYGFFTYWLPLNTLMILMLVCVAASGLHRFALLLSEDVLQHHNRKEISEEQ